MSNRATADRWRRGQCAESGITRSGGRTAIGGRLGAAPQLVVVISLGILLNPLNSSLMAVGVVTFGRQFDVGVATSTWLQSAFYLSAAVGQPLMGRLVDLCNPRRVFIAGLLLVLVASLAAPFASDFGWLVLARAAQAFGGAAAFPAAMVILRETAPSADRPPTGALAVFSMTGVGAGTFGPVLGGLLIQLVGWRALFWLSASVAIVGIAAALVVLPRSLTRPHRSVWMILRGLDILGVFLFTMAITSVLMFLLSLAHRPQWWLAGVAVAALIFLVLHDRAVAAPFLDIRGLAGNRPLISVLSQATMMSFFIYGFFLGMPIWLDAVRGMTSSSIGLLALPLNVSSLLIIPVGAWMIRRRGPRLAMVLGSLVMFTGAAGLQLLNDRSPIAMLLLIGIVVGIGDGFDFIGLQTGMYAASPRDRAGGSGGLFQACRYLGATLATSMLGVAFDRDLSSTGLHHVGAIMSIAASATAVLAALLPATLGRRDAALTDR